MKPLSGFVCLSSLALTALGRQFPIPAVDSAVSQVLSEYASYTAFAGPTEKTTSAAAQSTNARFNNARVNVAVTDPAYWLAQMPHVGKSSFNSNSGYQVWRNVKDFGAKGDGQTDDTAAINAAISSGNRCAPGSCQSTTTTPALVYFPAGTYLVSRPIIQYYYTQLHGNPNGRAVIKANSNFTGFALVDSNPYQSNGNQAYGSTNVFWRQVRNVVLDLTSVPSNSYVVAIHWPTSQATSLQNVQVNLSQAAGTQHVGIFCENGSAGFLGDIVVYGGRYAFSIGNQQFTIRNVAIYNAATAINQLWSWGFTYKSLTITNCSVALDMSALDDKTRSIQQVGAVLIADSTITNTPVFVKTARNTVPNPPAAGALLLENIVLSNVGTAVQGSNGATLLVGGSRTIAGWSQGQSYTPSGPSKVQGAYTPATRPSSLVSNGKFYEASKPQYESLPTASVLSVKSQGAVGDGKTDDTSSIKLALSRGAATGKLVFFDAGTYRVTSTIYFPPNVKVAGESYSVIMSSGSFFNDQKNPQPVVQIGKPGASGSVQWSDMIVSTQGAQAGAILIQWNLAAAAGSGMWDVHTRIGGFAGSNQQLANCPTTAAPSASCNAAYMSMHVTKSASGVYLENVWLWTADHDIEDPNLTQISIYTGRGLLFESTAGTAWLYGTCVEHHQLYQYNYVNTKNVVVGHATIETPYYQPVPDARNGPFAANATYNDPDFSKICTLGGNCDAVGLRIAGSNNIHHYGAGLYSFFNQYSTKCSDAGGPENCQSVIFDIENSTSINNYVLSTVGTTCMVYRDGKCLANYSDNVSVYPDTIVQFRSG